MEELKFDISEKYEIYKSLEKIDGIGSEQAFHIVFKQVLATIYDHVNDTLSETGCSCPKLCNLHPLEFVISQDDLEALIEELEDAETEFRSGYDLGYQKAMEDISIIAETMALPPDEELDGK